MRRGQNNTRGANYCREAVSATQQAAALLEFIWDELTTEKQKGVRNANALQQNFKDLYLWSWS
jgi:23S rRNA maturation mini-RNase III